MYKWNLLWESILLPTNLQLHTIVVTVFTMVHMLDNAVFHLQYNLTYVAWHNSKVLYVCTSVQSVQEIGTIKCNSMVISSQVNVSVHEGT